MTTNRILAAALADNAELIRKFGSELQAMPALWSRYRRNLRTIEREQMLQAERRKVEA